MLRFMIAALLCVACGAVLAKPNTLIAGKISNAANNKVYLFRELAFAQTDWPAIDSTTCDASGNFKLALNLTDPLACAVSNSQHSVRLFVAPGDSLSVAFDINNFPASVSFAGKGGPENTFYLRYRQQYTAPINQQKLYGSRPAYYAYLCDSLYGAAGKAFQDYFAAKKSNPAFEAFLSQKAMYLAASRKMMYPVYQRFVKRDDSNEARIDTSYYTFLRKLPFDNPVAYQSDSYADFLYWYYKERAYEALNVRSVQETDERILTKQFDIAASELKNKPLEIALAATVVKMLDNSHVTNAGKMIEVMKQRGASVETVAWVEKHYDRYKHLAYGAQAKDFTLPDSTGKMVSLSSLKGRAVFIDVWASWCGPCRHEMPYSRQLIEKLKGEPVTFLFVSIDERPEAWKRAMAQEKLPGVHLLDHNGWGSTLTNDYNFHSIPHYILIDKDGNMVDPDAQRPSGGAYEEIKALLARKAEK